MMDRENARIAIRMEMLRSPARKWINFEFWVEHMSDVFVTLSGDSEQELIDLRSRVASLTAMVAFHSDVTSYAAGLLSGDSEPPEAHDGCGPSS